MLDYLSEFCCLCNKQYSSGFWGCVIALLVYDSFFFFVFIVSSTLFVRYKHFYIVFGVEYFYVVQYLNFYCLFLFFLKIKDVNLCGSIVCKRAEYSQPLFLSSSFLFFFLLWNWFYLLLLVTRLEKNYLFLKSSCIWFLETIERKEVELRHDKDFY